LIVISGNTVVIQQVDPALLDYGEDINVTTWPGPLIKGETNKEDVLEYIRTLESSLKFKGTMMQTMSASSSNLDELDSVSLQNPEAYFKGHERRQLWSLLSMLVKQNGIVSGADLSELLLSNNESEFETVDEADHIGKVRRYLTLGQKKTALEYAQKSGLWGHVSSLILFNTLLTPVSGLANPSSFPIVNSTPEFVLSQQMCGMVSKFINMTLTRDDALFILYRCLLTKLQSKNNKGIEDNTNNKAVTTDNLQQFAILVANDCDVSPGVSSYGRSSELLKLMISIRNNTTQHLVNLGSLDLPDLSSVPTGSTSSVAVKYTDELVFLNEIWEFARTQTEFIEILIPFKTILAARLFDFGLINQATKYCYALRQYFTYYDLYFQGKDKSDSILDWDILMNIITDLECRIYGFDVRGSATTSKQSNIPSPKKGSPESDDMKDGGDSIGDTPDERTESSRNQDNKSTSSVKNRKGTESDEDEDSLGETRKRNLSSSRSNQKQTYQRRESDQNRPPSTGVQNITEKGKNRSESSSSQTNNPYQHHPVQRRRTLSREDSQETSPSPTRMSASESPVKQFNSNPIPTFEMMSMNKKRDSIESPPLNFVASSIPLLPLPGDSVNKGHPRGSQVQAYSEEDTFEEENDSLRRDSFASPQPFSSTQRNIPSFNASGVNQPFDAAFSPITSPEPYSIMSPVGQQPNNNEGVRRNSFSGETVKTQDHNNDDDNLDGKLESKGNKSKGWLGSIGNLLNRTPRAVLPDDSKKSIVWDEKLKMWIDKDDPDSMKQATAVLSGPPKGPLMGMNPPGRVSLPANIGGSNSPSMTGNGLVASSLQSFDPPIQQQRSPPSSSSGPSSLPMIPTAHIAASNPYNLVKKKRPQYIDVWQQTQKKT
jgi:hypothetical protein